MTTTEPAPNPVVRAAQRPECVACGRPYGRPRSPQVSGDALLDCAELVVCDQCWHTAGGTDAVQARLDGDQLAPVLEFPPEVEALLAGADEYDLLHPVDRFLVESGIRWAVLRHIAVPARCDLVRWVLERTPPECTRTADSPDVWIEAVEARIREQTGPGQEFRYNAKRRRWWRVCNVLRCRSNRRRRPLTWRSQQKIAAEVGCDERTVRRVVRWLKREGLLFEVVPGCQLPAQVAPDGETAEERADREHRLAAAIAAENAAIARAEAELEAVRTGLLGDAAVEAAEEALSPDDLAALAAAEDLEPGLVQIAPVYELRVPVTAAEAAEEAAIARAVTVLRSPGEELAQRHAADLVHPSNVSLYGELVAIGHDGTLTWMDALDAANALTCGNVAGLLRTDENVHPPQVCSGDQLKSSSVQAVDSGPPSAGSDQEGVRTVENGAHLAAEGRSGAVEGDRPKPRQSEAVRCAQWLKHSRLHPTLCDEVSVRWLAGLIRGSGLLDRWRWSWDDLADHLHGLPEYPQLPRFIRSPRAWIKKRFQRAIPELPPAALRQRLTEPDADRALLYEHARLIGAPERVLDLIARGDDETSQRRRDEAERARRAEIAERRAAINRCPMCDENGLLAADPQDPHAPLLWCNHDPDTQGW